MVADMSRVTSHVRAYHTVPYIITYVQMATNVMSRNCQDDVAHVRAETKVETRQRLRLDEDGVKDQDRAECKEHWHARARERERER